jgi:hypothetical protein
LRIENSRHIRKEEISKGKMFKERKLANFASRRKRKKDKLRNKR